VAAPGGHRLFDSIAAEASGNICVTSIPDGISVYSPDGSLVEVAPMAEPFATNICFGGPGLSTAYITLSSTGRLAEAPWRRKGLALNY
jgi:gluconolactonase